MDLKLEDGLTAKHGYGWTSKKPDIEETIYTCFFSTWFWLKNKNGCVSTSVRCQKRRLVMTAACFGAHHLRGTPAPGEGLGTQDFCAEKSRHPCKKSYVYAQRLITCVRKSIDAGQRCEPSRISASRSTIAASAYDPFQRK